MTVKEIAHWFNCEKYEIKNALAKLAEHRAFDDEELADSSDPRLAHRPARRKSRRNK